MMGAENPPRQQADVSEHSHGEPAPFSSRVEPMEEALVRGAAISGTDAVVARLDAELHRTHIAARSVTSAAAWQAWKQVAKEKKGTAKGKTSASLRTLKLPNVPAAHTLGDYKVRIVGDSREADGVARAQGAQHL